VGGRRRRGRSGPPRPPPRPGARRRRSPRPLRRLRSRLRRDPRRPPVRGSCAGRGRTGPSSRTCIRFSQSSTNELYRSGASEGGSVRRPSRCPSCRAGGGSPRAFGGPCTGGLLSSPRRTPLVLDPEGRDPAIQLAELPLDRDAIDALDCTGFARPHPSPPFHREASSPSERAGSSPRVTAPPGARRPARGRRPVPAGHARVRRGRGRRRAPRSGGNRSRAPPARGPPSRRQRHGGPPPHEPRPGPARRRGAGGRPSGPPATRRSSSTSRPVVVAGAAST